MIFIYASNMKKLHQNIKIIPVSLSSKKWYLLLKKVMCSSLLLQIKLLHINKATQESDIPTELVKRFDNLVVNHLQEPYL